MGTILRGTCTKCGYQARVLTGGGLRDCDPETALSAARDDRGLAAALSAHGQFRIERAPAVCPRCRKLTAPAQVTYRAPDGIILQIGAEYGEILTVPRFYLSLDALKMGDLDISTQTNAWASMPVIQNAINRVSSIRATYGALQNRLEHNQNQLENEIENITDAESRIRDTDMAEEMMLYTRSSILIQSAQAMLAQANQFPQNALSLLR